MNQGLKAKSQFYFLLITNISSLKRCTIWKFIILHTNHLQEKVIK